MYKIRVILINILKKILLGKIAGRIPLSTVRHLHEILDKKEFKNKIEVIKKIDDAFIKKYEFDNNDPYRFPREKSFNTKYIYKISNALVASHSGVIILQEHEKVLLQSVGSLNRVLGWGRVLEDLVMDPLKGIKVDNDVIVCPDTGYFHWLLEVMPNFIYTYQYNKDNLKILVSPNANRYLIEALNYLLGEKARASIIKVSKKALVKNIYFATFEDESGFVRIKDINILRSAFKKLMQTTIPQKKIYVSRRKSSKRKIGNELEVEKKVSSYGYEIVYAEELSFEQQIKTFSSASHIIGAHGAGLSNIVWCNPNIKLIEIFPHNNLHFCYATLALTMNLNYKYLECSEDKNSFGVVNLNELEDKLK
jgi:hypothetical protein